MSLARVSHSAKEQIVADYMLSVALLDVNAAAGAGAGCCIERCIKYDKCA